LRLCELVMTIVPGSVEDERMFSALNFLRNARRNRLQPTHLTACARLFSDLLFSQSTFPFEEAIGVWYDAAAVRGRYAGVNASHPSATQGSTALPPVPPTM
jgi:hypothetical protein